eukprot:2782517-Rhodomonas_salina.1
MAVPGATGKGAYNALRRGQTPQLSPASHPRCGEIWCFAGQFVRCRLRKPLIPAVNLTSGTPRVHKRWVSLGPYAATDVK